MTDNGPGDSSGFSVDDPVPAGVAITGVSAVGIANSVATTLPADQNGCKTNGNDVSCVEGPLRDYTAGNGFPQFQVTITGTAPAVSGSLTNTATVTGLDPEEPGCGPATDYPCNGSSMVTTSLPVVVTISGSQTYGSNDPTFSYTSQYGGATGTATCTTVNNGTLIAPTLAADGSYTLDAVDCSGPVASAADPLGDTVRLVGGAFTVNPANVTVTVSGSETYGGAPMFTTSVSPDVAVTGTLSCTRVLFVGTESTLSITSPTPAVNSYSVIPSSCSGLSASSNYNLVYVGAAGGFVVNPALLAITASDGSMTFGGAAPTITPSYASLVNGDTASSLTTAPACAAGDTSQSVGTYAGSTTCSGATDSNYTISYVSGALTVSPATLTVTVSGSETYGGAPMFTTSVSPDVAVTGTLSCTRVLFVGTESTLSITSPTPAVNSYSVIPSSCSGLSASSNYNLVYVGAAGGFVVNPALLAITASDGSMTFGGAAPTITPSYASLVNGDTASSLTTAPACAAGDTSQSVGTYAGSTTCSGATDSNYTISYVSGALTVSPATLTVTVSGSETYGGAPMFTTSVSPDVAVTGALTCKDVLVGQAGSAISAPTPAVGSYSIEGASCSGLSASSNYNLVYAGAEVGFVVNPALLAITASSAPMAYGGVAPTISPSYASFVNGDTASSLTTAPTCSAPADISSSGVGSYSTSCAAATDANYTISYDTGSVIVDPAPLTVRASSPAMTYGGTVPAITASYSGFVNGDTASSLTAAPTCSAPGIVPSSPAGAHKTSCTTAVDANYSFTYATGVLTMRPAVLTITASSPSINYGSAVPAITPTYSGFVNGETAASLRTAPECTTSATASSLPGRYETSCARASDVNYSIRYVNGKLSIIDLAGYRLEGGDGGLFTFHRSFAGSVPPPSLGLHIFDFVAMASVTNGYWLVERNGGVFAFGAARFLGSLPGEGIHVDDIVGVARTPDGGGYWMLSSNGAVYAFGDAKTHGDGSGLAVGNFIAIASPDAGGYWLLTASGSVYPYGDVKPLADCRQAGSGCNGVNDIVGMAVRNGAGYWLAGRDGGVFGFGDAHYQGSCPHVGSGCRSVNDVVGIASTDAGGYWLAEADGNVLSFGDARFLGRCGETGSACVPLVRPIVAIDS